MAQGTLNVVYGSHLVGVKQELIVINNTTIIYVSDMLECMCICTHTFLERCSVLFEHVCVQ